MHHDTDQQGNGPRRPFQGMRDQFNLVIALAQIISAPVEPWLRKAGSFGSHYFGFHLVAGLAAMLVVPALCFPTHDLSPVLGVLLATLLVLVCHRVKGAYLRRRGFVVHSRYSGTPWLPGDEITAKILWEPSLVMLAGGAMCLLSPPLGTWMFAAGFGLGLAHRYQQDADNARLRAMRDARIEAEYYADRFRNEMGEE